MRSRPKWFVGFVNLEPAAHRRAESEGFDAAAASGVARPLVEDDEDDSAPQLGRVQQRDDVLLEPRVAGRDRAVVHVVAEVRHHEREVRQPVPRQVAPELGERYDAVAACPGAGDVAEVEERVVLLRVAAGRAAGEAGIREILGIRLPGLAGGRERVGEAPGVDDAVGAVARDPVRGAGDEREVVRQARVADGVVLRQRGVAVRERVERRRVGAPGDRARLVVLEHDDDDMREVRDVHGRRRHFRDGRPDPAPTAGGREREGRREQARYNRSSSHFLPERVKKKAIRTATTIPTAA